MRGVALLLALAACGAPAPTDDEGRLRARLGVPAEAKRVVLFSQSAHLDVDWQKTFEDYYATWVDDIFTEARGLLDQQPRAFYSVAEMAYLERYLYAHPEAQASLRAHAARGALRVVGGGVTSPDTLLPETELLLRDFMYGVRFSEEVIGVTPHVAWLPDSFGHAATVPDVLAAIGFDGVGFARVDGAPTFYEAIRDPTPPLPRSGSTAELLTSVGADFVWQGPGGGAVQAHWIASGLYCTGDNLDYDEPIQIPGGHLAPQEMSAKFTDARIDEYVAALAPTARTPYVFVPVGCDFQHPKPELVAYLDGYNQRRYAATGVWAVAAPFDDYLALVGAHKDALPAMPLDITPYFTGFYGTRAAVKAQTRAAARPFFAAESLATALDDGGRAASQAWGPALARLTRADHHDWVTGTANDAVATTEQLPALDDARVAGEAALGGVVDALAAQLPPTPGAVGRFWAYNPSDSVRNEVVEVPWARGAAGSASASGSALPVALVRGDAGARLLRAAISDLPPFAWRAVDVFAAPVTPAAAVTLALSDDADQPARGAAVTRVTLANARVRARWQRTGGFALTSLTVDGVELLGDRSFLVTEYADQGGLWRLGHEMRGCSMSANSTLADEAAGETVRVLEATPLSATVQIVSATTVREARLDAGAAWLDVALTTAAAEATTRTARFHFAAPSPAALATGLAGGFAARPVEREYTPTYWPAVDWLSVGGAVVLLRQSTGVRFSADGDAELLAVRNAQMEHCDLEGGTGSDGDAHRIAWRLTAAASPAAAARAAQAYNRPLVVRRVGLGAAGGALPLERSLLSSDGDGVVTALKPAERGDGVIVRALLLPGPVTLRLSPALATRARWRSDAVERDLNALPGDGDSIVLDRATYGSIATVRLR